METLQTQLYTQISNSTFDKQTEGNTTNEKSEINKYESQLTAWEDDIVGTYLLIVCKYTLSSAI